jgi:anti-sigma regulatory factor (Ser/Thr protein kinase)
VCAAPSTPAGLEHRALLYDELEQAVAASEAVVREGFERDERVRVALDSPLAAALKERLGADSPAVEWPGIDGDSPTPARLLTSFAYALAALTPGRGFRALVEPPLSGSHPGARREWMRFEAILNRALDGHRAYVVCPYERGALTPEEAAAIDRSHPHIAIERGVADNAGFAGTEPALAALEIELEPAPDAAASLRFDDRPAPAREFVADRAAAAGLPVTLVDDLRVAATEIITNAILHGRRPHWIHVWTTDAELLCEVQDDGPGVGSPMTGFLLPDVEAPSGRGVWIARQLCERLEIDGARVRLHVRRGP